MIAHVNAPQTSKCTNDFTQMVGDLRHKADSNGDGSVSAAEFAQFLDHLIDQPGAKPGAEAQTTSKPTRTESSSAPVIKG